MTPKQYHRVTLKRISKYIHRNFLEGIFVECGVKQGTSSAIMAKYSKLHGVLFDTWCGFPHFSKYDIVKNNRIKKLKKRVHRGKDTLDDCKNTLEKSSTLHLCSMVKGDILETVPKYFEWFSDSVCLLHIDTDLYMPAQTSLSAIWPYLANRGIVLIHDYRDKRWPGITKCVDDFVMSNKDSKLYDCNSIFCGAIIVKNGVSEKLELEVKQWIHGSG